MASLNTDAQELIQSDSSIRQRLGITVISAQDGNCQLSAKIDESWLNGAGFIHGSVAYALMDSASAYACASKGVRGVTTNGNITYVRGARAETTLVASAQVVSQSRRVMSLTATVQDSEEQLLAHGNFLFQLF